MKCFRLAYRRWPSSTGVVFSFRWMGGGQVGTEGTVAPHRYRRAKEFDRNVRVQREKNQTREPPCGAHWYAHPLFGGGPPPSMSLTCPSGNGCVLGRMGCLRRGYAYVKISEKGGRRDVLKELRTGTEGRPVRSGPPHTHGLSPVARASRGSIPYPDESFSNGLFLHDVLAQRRRDHEQACERHLLENTTNRRERTSKRRVYVRWMS